MRRRAFLALVACAAVALVAPADDPVDQVFITSPGFGNHVNPTFTAKGWGTAFRSITVEAHLTNGYVYTQTTTSNALGDWSVEMALPASYSGATPLVAYLTTNPIASAGSKVIVD